MLFLFLCLLEIHQAYLFWVIEAQDYMRCSLGLDLAYSGGQCREGQTQAGEAEMNARSYLRALFSKDAFRALLGILIGTAFASFSARKRFWESVARDEIESD